VRPSRAWLAAASVALVLVLAGCAIFGRSGGRQDRFARPGSPRPSPSGAYIASVVPGPPENGVDTLVVVITDQSGHEVFRDDDAYSTRHGVGVTWLSDRDQLWILSADVGHSYVEIRDGRWAKVDITPETTASVPGEIASLD
jgi:hypothetical protein